MKGDDLSRFPPVLSPSAQISSQQLGWRIAVLPFRSHGSAAGYGIALGMAEEVSAAVSRYRSPRLVAPVTFWDGVGPSVDFLNRCQLYKLDYAIEGTILVVGDHIRVDVILLDVVLGFEVIWTGHFDGRMDDLYALQERIAAEMVAQLDPDLSQQGQQLQAPAKTSVAAAHHAVLTAVHWILQLNPSKFMRARELLEQAVELDPAYAAAHAWIAYWCIIAVGLGIVPEPRVVTGAAGASAERAVQLDPSDARALAIAGHVKGYLLHDVTSALALHARATELNPNLSIAWTLSAWSKIYNGEHTTAIRHALVAQSLSPRDPHIFFTEHAMATAYFFNRQLAEADTLTDIALTRHPGHATAVNIRLAVLGHMGRVEEALESLSAIRETRSDVSIAAIADRAPWRPADKAYYREGLRLAGVPEI